MGSYTKKTHEAPNSKSPLENEPYDAPNSKYPLENEPHDALNSKYPMANEPYEAPNSKYPLENELQDDLNSISPFNYEPHNTLNSIYPLKNEPSQPEEEIRSLDKPPPDFIQIVPDDGVNQEAGSKGVHDEVGSKGGFFRGSVTVEPVLFLFNIASMISWVTSQDLMVQKACLINFGYSEDICENLSDFEEEEVAVQQLVSTYLMWRSILETAIKMLSVPLLGWWADNYGQKWPLILCLVALGLESASLLANSLATAWPLEAILFGSLFYGASGGVHSLLMLAFSFMARRTTLRQRTLRMGILDGFYYLGSPVGAAIASPLFRATGYAGVFGFCCAIHGVTVAYVFLLTSRGQSNSQNREQHGVAKCSDCGITRITNAFYTTLKPRPSGVRTMILVTILAMLFDSFVIWGESNVKYLFVQRALDWDYTQYNHYGTTSSFLAVIGALVLVPAIVLYTPITDPIIGLIGAISRSLERVLYVFANQPSRAWMMYVGCVLGIGSPMAPIAIRSLLSKLAQGDVGQVYAVMAVGESLLPFASAPLYNGIYEATVEGFPGAYYLLSIGLNILLAICFVFLFIAMRRRPNE